MTPEEMKLQIEKLERENAELSKKLETLSGPHRSAEQILAGRNFADLSVDDMLELHNARSRGPEHESRNQAPRLGGE